MLYITPLGVRLCDIDCKNGIFMKLTMVAGNIIMDDANIGGITPAVLSLRGRGWEPPPMTFLPTTLFGYCTGLLLCPVSTKNIKATTPSIIIIKASIKRKFNSPVLTRVTVLPTADGI